MAIDRITWTDHALLRLDQRGLSALAVEAAVRDGHDNRVHNLGEADWLVETVIANGRGLGVIYDHPVRGDDTHALIVSAWSTD